MEIEELRSRALDQLLENVRTGFDPYYQQRYTYVMPSIGRYEWQWFWDSCFHAIALVDARCRIGETGVDDAVDTSAG